MLAACAWALAVLACGEPPAPDCPGSEERACETTCGTDGVQRRAEGACELSACEPPPERCNGADDDCDGRADEDFPCVAGAHAPCETACGSEGSRSCSEACGWSACTPPREICGNGVDDDCDGVSDGGPTVAVERAFRERRRPVAIAGADGRFWVAVAGEGETVMETDVHGVAELSAELGFDALAVASRMRWASGADVVLLADEGEVALVVPDGRRVQAAIFPAPPAMMEGATSAVRVVAPDAETVRGPLGATFREGSVSLAYSVALGPSGVRRARAQRLGAGATAIVPELEISSGNGETGQARGVSWRPQLAWNGSELLALFRASDFSTRLLRLTCE